MARKPSKKTPGARPKRPTQRAKTRGSRSWEAVAPWYDGWVGKRGSHYHQKLALPTTLELLGLAPGERLLDLGSGSGVLAPHARKAGATYVGVELSPTLVQLARRHHGGQRRGARGGKGAQPEPVFIQGDARHLPQLGLEPASFEAVTFLLSLQDMTPLDEVIAAASWALAPGGRLVAFMVHPCFRVPRQSGWGYDPQRKLTYRRVDRYLTPLDVPMKAHAGGVTRSYHRPLEAYVSALAMSGLCLDALLELPDIPLPGRADDNPDIPLFLALRARKML